MKYTYPVSLTRTDEGFLVHVPDFNYNTQGKAEAMAIDVIEFMGADCQADGKTLPAPSELYETDGDIITLVDFD